MSPDADDNLALLLDLFPDENLEFIYNSLLENDCDIDRTIKSILDSDHNPSRPSNAFDHLITTFPDVEIEAIEAFLLTCDEDDNFDKITREFMIQFESEAKSPVPKRKDLELKMKLTEFSALLRTSNDSWEIKSSSRRNSKSMSDINIFNFTFLDDDDLRDWDDLKGKTVAEVRRIANDLQTERIEILRKAASTYRSGNFTGKTSASYYSDQGQSLAPKVNRINRIAAELIFLERNPNYKFSKSIDLHHLTVSEAQSLGSAFLRHHETLKTPTIQIITGRGNHSSGGNCKLSAAIWNLLRAKKLKYSFDGIATFTINFR